MPARPGMRPALEKVIAPYLEIQGIDAAGLVSSDGLLVAWLGDDAGDPESLAANAAAAISSLESMARELGARPPRVINAGLPGRDLIIARLTDELCLILIGREAEIRGLACNRSLGR
jgi:predicted regulator of Ras-like GTPase activity (Roadblock/LC7/MglB family)